MVIHNIDFLYLSYLKQKTTLFWLQTPLYCVIKRCNRNFRGSPNCDCVWKIIPVGYICIIFAMKRTRYQIKESCVCLSWDPEIIPVRYLLALYLHTYSLHICGRQKVSEVGRQWHTGVGKCLWYAQRDSHIHA